MDRLGCVGVAYHAPPAGGYAPPWGGAPGVGVDTVDSTTSTSITTAVCIQNSTIDFFSRWRFGCKGIIKRVSTDGQRIRCWRSIRSSSALLEKPWIRSRRRRRRIRRLLLSRRKSAVGLWRRSPISSQAALLFLDLLLPRVLLVSMESAALSMSDMKEAKKSSSS